MVAAIQGKSKDHPRHLPQSQANPETFNLELYLKYTVFASQVGPFCWASRPQRASSAAWGGPSRGRIRLGHSCRVGSSSRTRLLSENLFLVGCGFPLINYSCLRVRRAASPLFLQPRIRSVFGSGAQARASGDGAVVDSAGHQAASRLGETPAGDTLEDPLPSADFLAGWPRRLQGFAVPGLGLGGPGVAGGLEDRISVSFSPFSTFLPPLPSPRLRSWHPAGRSRFLAPTSTPLLQGNFQAWLGLFGPCGFLDYEGQTSQAPRKFGPRRLLAEASLASSGAPWPQTPAPSSPRDCGPCCRALRQRVCIKLVSLVAFNSLVTSKLRREASYAGLGFKGAAGCGWDHLGIRVSPNGAQSASRPERWDRIFIPIL